MGNVDLSIATWGRLWYAESKTKASLTVCNQNKPHCLAGDRQNDVNDIRLTAQVRIRGVNKQPICPFQQCPRRPLWNALSARRSWWATFVMNVETSRGI